MMEAFAANIQEAEARGLDFESEASHNYVLTTPQEKEKWNTHTLIHTHVYAHTWMHTIEYC